MKMTYAEPIDASKFLSESSIRLHSVLTMLCSIPAKNNAYDVFDEITLATNICREKWEKWYAHSSQQAPSAELMEAAALAYPIVGSFLFGVEDPVANHARESVFLKIPLSPDEITDRLMRSYLRMQLDLKRNLWHNNTWTEAEKIFMDANSLTREEATEKIVSIMMETYIKSKRLLPKKEL